MNTSTAYNMLAAVADEVASDNDLPEEAVHDLLKNETFLESFTADLVRAATQANPDGSRQSAEDDATADFLRNSHERVLAGLKAAAAT
jgi:hypothetical protein